MTGLALSGAPITDVTRCLSAGLGAVVVVLDTGRDVISESSPEPEEGTDNSEGARETEPDNLRPRRFSGADWGLEGRGLLTAFETAAANHLPLHLPSTKVASQGWVLAPIFVSEETLGYLMVSRRSLLSGEELDLLSVQHAASIFALALLQERRDADIRARYRRELVEALLVGRLSRPKAAELAILAGLVPDLPYWVAAVAPLRNGERATPLDPLMDILARTLDGLGPGTLAIARSDHVAVFLPLLDETGLAAPEVIAEYGRNMVAAVGSRFSAVGVRDRG